MRVKELELSGFKSFVDRVKLNFKPGITALVGPNGCGKSNVIDAMRWIMGEHNARHLRGNKMEDLIFNGSETRKSTGMAEVSLILSNNGNGNGKSKGNGNGNGNGNGHGSSLGSASEIMVTRRLFRSGDSEYLINKIPCRLKDIVEIFLDSGVGTRSYSIMEQGKVDYILSLKPDERRILVEEAAGISKYRSRKKEALSKMQSTRNNLFRLKDVLNELQIQMKGLDLQVKRLKRYRNIKEEIKEIDLQLASTRLCSMRSDQETFQKELTRCRDEEIRISTEKNTSESLVEKSRLELTELQRKLAQLQQDSYQIKNDIQNQENSRQYNERDLCNTFDLIKRNDQNLAEIESDLKKIDAEIVDKKSEFEQIEAGIQSLQQSFQSSSETLQVSRNSLNDIHEQLEQEKKNITSVAYEKTEVKNAILLNKRLQEEIRIKLQKLRDEKQTCETSLAELEKNKLLLEKQLDELIVQREDKEKQIESLRQKIEDLSRDLHERNQCVNEMKDRIASVSARLDSLRELQTGMEGFSEGVRMVMNPTEQDDPGLNGIVGLFADIIETSSEHELAVEAALDRKLQSVIVQTPEDGLKVIDYLKNQKNGRITFIPMTLKAENTQDLSSREGLPLLSVITTKPEFQPLAEVLLADVLLVENIDQGLKIWERSQKNFTIATRDGEIIDPRGIVTGGSIIGAGSGILKRNREIREFSEQLQILEEQFLVLKAEREKTEQNLQQARQAYEKLSAEKQELDIQLVQEKTKEEQAEKDLLQEKEKYRLLTFEESESSDTLKTHQNELELQLSKESVLNRTEEEKQILLGRLVENEAGMKEGLAESESQNTELRIDLAQIQQKRENVVNNSNILAERKSSSLSKISFLKNDGVGYREKTEILAQKIEGSKVTLQQLLENGRLLDEKIAAEQKSVLTLEEAVQTHERNLKELRTGWEEIEPRVHDTELKLSNISIHLEHLDKEILDKYGLSFDELPPPPESDSFNEDESAERLEKLKKRLENIGEVNLGAASEYEELDKRLQFLTSQEEDLLSSIESLQKVITKINRITKQKFLETFNDINGHFKKLFPLLFNGGKAYMQLTDENDLLETGIDIFSQPPGKKLQSLDLLSGGERALTVIALMFGIFLTKPSPFCLMDEIDAPLDDSNIGRFIDHLHDMAERSQFIIVTHNKLSMQAADSLYGVTMEERGVSKIVSVELN